MGIRFVHQAGAGMIGAFAAGQAASKRRGQKYALDRMQQQQQHQNRMQERLAGSKYRGALGGGRRGGGMAGGMGGRWVDPVAASASPNVNVQRNAQYRAAARAGRLGQAPRQTDLLPQFQSQAEVEQQELAAEQKREDFEWQRGQEAREGESDLAFRRRDFPSPT